jgi:hypothetical protein
MEVGWQDFLACLLFNTVLEKVITVGGINIRGTISYKSVQILKYARDTDVIIRI